MTLMNTETLNWPIRSDIIDIDIAFQFTVVSVFNLKGQCGTRIWLAKPFNFMISPGR